MPKYTLSDLGYNLSLTKSSFQEIEQTTPESSSVILGGTSAKNIISGDLSAKVNLVTGYLQSDNFVSGSAGWQLDSDGNIEANDGTFRGDITGATITASLIQTATSGERIELRSDTKRINLINSSGHAVAVMTYGSATSNAILRLAPTDDARRGLEFIVGATLGSDAKCITIDNPSSSISIDITDGGSTALSIAGSSAYGILISHSGTNAALDISANANAPCINLVASAYPGVQIAQDGTSHGVYITQGNDAIAHGIYIDNDANSHVSHCLQIERLADADDQLVAAVVIKSANQGVGGRACGIDFTDAIIQGIFNVAADATDPTGGGGAATGRIPIYVGGSLKYLAYY